MMMSLTSVRRLLVLGTMAALVLVLAPIAGAGPYVGWDLRMVDTNQNPANTTDAILIGDSPVGGPYPGSYTASFDGALGYKIPDWGTGGSYAYNQNYPSGVNATDSFVLKATADVTIPAGTWTVGFASDDGGAVQIPGVDMSAARFNTNGTQPYTYESRYEGTRGSAWTGGQFTLASPLTTTMSVYQYEQGGGDSLEIGIFNGAAGGWSASWLPLTDGAFGWSVTSNLPYREMVQYRITVAAPTTGTATVTGYLNESGTYNQLGTEFRAATSGTPSVTATGTVGMVQGLPAYLQLKGAWNGTGTPDQTSAPYIAATFTAPPGFIFSETGNQYVSTDTTWAAHSVAYGGIGWPGDTNLYALPSPSPTLASQGHPTAPSVAPQALWQISSLTFDPTTLFYLDSQATLVPGTWSVFGAQPNPAQPQGLSAHIVRVNSNLDNLGQVNTALTRVPNGTDHSVSQVTTIPRASLDSLGAFSNPAGYLPGAQDVAGAGPEDYAVKLAGYVYVDITDPVNGPYRSFAVSGDNRFYFSVGGSEFARTESAVAGGTPLICNMKFDATGYYPLELVYGNRDGTAGLEISVAPYTWDGTSGTWVPPAAFNTTAYQLLGTDAGFPVYQNPGAVPNPSTAGANTVGGILYAGAVSGTSDGLRVQQAYPAAAPTSVDSAITYFADKVIQNGDPTNFNVGVHENRTNLGMNDPGWAAPGNFTDQPFPINNRDASYNVVANKDDNNFVTRINGLVYIPAAGNYAVTNSSNEGYQLRIGNQQFGRRAGGGDTPAGTANYMYGYFPQAGLYPVEYYSYEATANSNIELAALATGATVPLVLPSRNPAANGFTTDLTGMVYSVQPRAMLRAQSTTLQMQAFGEVPALATVPLSGGKLGVVDVEGWKLEQFNYGVPGLWAQYYQYAGVTQWPAGTPTVEKRISTGSFNIPDHAWNAAPYNFTTDADPNYFASRWTGSLLITQAGQYRFNENVDDWARLYLDVSGDQIYQAGELLLNNQQWDVHTTSSAVTLGVGNYKIEFQTDEGGGGDNAMFQWERSLDGGLNWSGMTPFVFATDFITDEILTLASGTGAVGDLTNFADALPPFDFNSTYTLRLTVDIAGLRAVYEDTFNFVPEPGTMLLLAGGLLALARRRRRAAR